MKVRILDEVECDLVDGCQFYETIRAGLGRDFLDSLFEDIETLSDAPRGHPVLWGYRRKLARRFPFAIYIPSLGGVDRCLCGARLPSRSRSCCRETGPWFVAKGELDNRQSPIDNTPMIRKTVYYSGHVQGVGFRWTARNVGRGFDVTGTVQNLDDGRVKLVAEGEREEVDAMLAALARDMRQYIRATQVDTAEASGQFRGFSIVH